MGEKVIQLYNSKQLIFKTIEPSKFILFFETEPDYSTCTAKIASHAPLAVFPLVEWRQHSLMDHMLRGTFFICPRHQSLVCMWLLTKPAHRGTVMVNVDQSFACSRSSQIRVQDCRIITIYLAFVQHLWKIVFFFFYFFICLLLFLTFASK